MNSIFNRDGGFNTFFKTSPISTIVIFLNLIMLIVTLVMGGFNVITLDSLGGLTVAGVDNGEYYRLVASAFLHGDFLHFLSNMVIGLIVLGSGLERIIGSKKFSLIYFSTILISGASVYLVGSITDSNSITIGASGAIFGVLGSLLFLSINRRDLILERDLQSIYMLVVIQVVFTFLSSGVSVTGHISGIIYGFLISFLIIGKNPNYYDEDSDTYDFTIH